MFENQLLRSVFRRLPYVFAISLVCILVLAPRLSGFSGIPGNLLWAEDGHIFIKGAMEHGLGAMIEPYAGYLHVYPRMVASLAVLPDPWFLAYIMLFGWLMGYIVAALFVVRALRLQGLPMVAALVVIAMCAFTPTSGETLFTITNVQWHLGAALAVVVLVPSARKPSIVELVFVAVASLTGPFCIILLPLVAVRAWWFNDAYQRQGADLTLLVCALIQLSFLAGSDRVAAEISHDVHAWGLAFWAFVTFGGQGTPAISAALIFWAIYGIVGAHRLTVSGWRDGDLRSAVLFLLASGIFMLAGLYALRDSPGAASPLGYGGRYFVIPYYLLVISAVFLARQSRVSAASMLLILVVLDWQGFQRINRTDYGYDSYVEFASAVSNVFIPINPQFPGFQGGYRLSDGRGPSIKSQARQLDAGEIMSEAPGNWSVDVSDLGCTRAPRTLGLEARFSAPADSEIGATWDNSSNADRANVLYAGPGKVVYLALPWDRDAKDLRLHVQAPLGSAPVMTVTSLKVFCVGVRD